MGTGKDKRYFDRVFKYEAILLMNEGKRSVRDIASLGHSPTQTPHPMQASQFATAIPSPWITSNGQASLRVAHTTQSILSTSAT